MEIILPNNTIENPSVWDTDLLYNDQSNMAKEYVNNLFDTVEPVVDYEVRRPIQKIYTDTINSIKVTVNTNYRYDINHRACFVIQNEIVILEEI